MRRILSAIGLWLCLVSIGVTQCDSQGCPSSQQPSWIAASAREQPYPAMVVTEYRGPNYKNCGSGIIVWRNGTVAHVLTCAHGYEKGLRAAVVTQDGRTHWAEIVGIDAMQDVALLAIADPGIEPLKIAEQEPQAGERVYACGFDNAELTRFVGSWGSWTSYASYDQRNSIVLQTTCSMRPGTSGGPILNSRGQVVATIHGGGGGGLYIRPMPSART